MTTTNGMTSIRARGITFCGLRISPESVDIDSKPEYIHTPIARPTAKTPAGAEHRSARDSEGRQRIELPLGEADHDQHHEGRQYEYGEQGRADGYELDAENVDEGEDRDDRPANQVKRQLVKAQRVLQVADGENDIDRRIDEDGQRPPPGGLESPEIPQGAARPDIEPALARDGGIQFAGHQGHRQAPHQRQQQEQQQREAGAGGGNHVLDAERTSRYQDVDHEKDGDSRGPGSASDVQMAGVAGAFAHACSLSPGRGVKGLRALRAETGPLFNHVRNGQRRHDVSLWCSSDVVERVAGHEGQGFLIHWRQDRDIVLGHDVDIAHCVFFHPVRGLNQHNVAQLDVLEAAEKTVAVGRYAEVAVLVHFRHAFDPPGSAVEDMLFRAVVDRHLYVQIVDDQKAQRRRILGFQRLFVVLYLRGVPQGLVGFEK